MTDITLTDITALVTVVLLAAWLVVLNAQTAAVSTGMLSAVDPEAETRRAERAAFIAKIKAGLQANEDHFIAYAYAELDELDARW